MGSLLQLHEPCSLQAKVIEYYMILRVQETIRWYMSEEYPNLITARFLQAQQQGKLLRRIL